MGMYNLSGECVQFIAEMVFNSSDRSVHFGMEYTARDIPGYLAWIITCIYINKSFLIAY